MAHPLLSPLEKNICNPPKPLAAKAVSLMEIIKPFLRGMVVGRVRLTPQQVNTPTNITSQQIRTMPITPPFVMVPGIAGFAIFLLLMAALNQSTTLYPY